MMKKMSSIMSIDKNAASIHREKSTIEPINAAKEKSSFAASALMPGLSKQTSVFMDNKPADEKQSETKPEIKVNLAASNSALSGNNFLKPPSGKPATQDSKAKPTINVMLPPKPTPDVT